MSRYFPLALEVDGRPCVVLGNGAEAIRRASALLEAGALVSLVAESPSAELRELAAQRGLTLTERRPRGSDLDGHWLAVFSERDPALATELGAAANERRIWFCAVDDPRASSYAHMAQARAGLVTVSISTSGKAPALGRRLSEELRRVFDSAGLAAFAQKLAELRERTPSAERGRVLGEAVAGVELEGRLRLPE
ncbi:MAG: bifunctional precorrin-2 dehydrogenase/sirohydrochlorin ferrochelatase [Myxococcota bacterium]|jgi:siroheme synthase-like protein|nr:bifunctional precorrin-2 dehydrogenase/sirohydrochlorin ferrochelatase [Myxococcota bacterium]